MKYIMALWFSLVLFTIIFEASTYKCHKYGFAPATDASICRSEAMSNAMMAGAFPPVYWAFELTHK